MIHIGMRPVIDGLFIEVYDCLNESEIESIRSEMRLHKDYNNQYQNNEYQNREGYTVSEFSEETHNLIMDRIKKVAHNVVNPLYSPQTESADQGIEYHRYPPGSICREHADRELFFFGNQSLLRYATIVLHLSDNPDSDLVFPYFNKRIKTEAGKMVIFPPYGPYRHFTTESKTDREVIVTWLVHGNTVVIRYDV